LPLMICGAEISPLLSKMTHSCLGPSRLAQIIRTFGWPLTAAKNTFYESYSDHCRRRMFISCLFHWRWGPWDSAEKRNKNQTNWKSKGGLGGIPLLMLSHAWQI